MRMFGRWNFSFAFPVVHCRRGEALNGLVASVAMEAGFRMLGSLPKMPFHSPPTVVSGVLDEFDPAKITRYRI